MWTAILSLLVLMSQGTLGKTSESCQPVLQKCTRQSPYKNEKTLDFLLTSAKHMENVCRSVQQTWDCMSQAIANCTGNEMSILAASRKREPSTFAKLFINFGNVLAELCNKDTILHKGYTESTQCAKEYIGRARSASKCQNESHAAYNVYQDLTEDNPETIDETFEGSSKNCLMEIYKMGCELTVMKEECGDVAYSTFVTIVKRIQFFQLGVCSSERFSYVMANFLDIHEMDDPIFLRTSFLVKNGNKQFASTYLYVICSIVTIILFPIDKLYWK